MAIPGWSDMQIILCTINCHTKKRMLMPLISVFFLWPEYWKSVSHKLVWPINDFNATLYAQPLFSGFSNVAFYESHVLALWQSRCKCVWMVHSAKCFWTTVAIFFALKCNDHRVCSFFRALSYLWVSDCVLFSQLEYDLKTNVKIIVITSTRRKIWFLRPYFM